MGPLGRSSRCGRGASCACVVSRITLRPWRPPGFVVLTGSFPERMRSALARRGWRGGSEAIRAATAIAALRTLIGAGLIAAPGPMLRSWGYPREESQSATVRALLRTAGGRDLVLGLATLAARK